MALPSPSVVCTYSETIPPAADVSIPVTFIVTPGICSLVSLLLTNTLSENCISGKLKLYRSSFPFPPRSSLEEVI